MKENIINKAKWLFEKQVLVMNTENDEIKYYPFLKSLYLIKDIGEVTKFLVTTK